MRVFEEGRWMRRNGHNVILVAPEDSPLYQRAAQDRWETHSAAFTRSSMFTDFIKVRRLLKQIHPDVLNTHGNTDSKVSLTAAWGLNIPCVIRSRHYAAPVRNRWYNKILYLKLCHCIFTTADATTRQLVRDLSVPPDRCLTVATGIIPPVNLVDRETARKSLAQVLGLEGEVRFVGFVGRLAPDKGLSLLIEAVASIQRAIPSCHIVLIGSGGERKNLERQAQNLGIADRLHFTGYVEDPWPYFCALDCHVAASPRYEGTPQAILQAMFANCPVIGADTGGIRDVIIPGNTGMLVHPDSVPALADAIFAILNDPKEAEFLAQNAREFVDKNYSIDHMCNRILSIYERTISLRDSCEPRMGALGG